MSLQSYLPIIAFMKENRENKQQNNAISYYLYRKQHEDFNIEQKERKKERKISINFDKIGKEIYKKLEESIQKEADKRR